MLTSSEISTMMALQASREMQPIVLTAAALHDALVMAMTGPRMSISQAKIRASEQVKVALCSQRVEEV